MCRPRSGEREKHARQRGQRGNAFQGRGTGQTGRSATFVRLGGNIKTSVSDVITLRCRDIVRNVHSVTAPSCWDRASENPRPCTEEARGGGVARGHTSSAHAHPAPTPCPACPVRGAGPERALYTKPVTVKRFSEFREPFRRAIRPEKGVVRTPDGRPVVSLDLGLASGGARAGGLVGPRPSPVGSDAVSR